ncbi:MAG: two pore domain potassium channel family protein [Rhodobacteraceae bacterium]|nr:two pore domain potassium channel family protein [Paracoccaceae bacterium]
MPRPWRFVRGWSISGATMGYAIVYGKMEIPNPDENGMTLLLSGFDRLYFSIVTFTTLGYGDISPSGDFRLLAASQAFMGFIFVPIIIAELSVLAYWERDKK